MAEKNNWNWENLFFNQSLEFSQQNQGTGGRRYIEEKAERLKDDGNTALRGGDNLFALKLYTEALSLALSIPHNERQGAVICSNISHVNLNLARKEVAREAAKQAVVLNSTWHKGYFRLAKAYESMQMSPSAFRTLKEGFERAKMSENEKNQFLQHMLTLCLSYSEGYKSLHTLQFSPQMLISLFNGFLKEREWKCLQLVVLGNDIQVGLIQRLERYQMNQLDCVSDVYCMNKDSLAKYGQHIVVELLKNGLPMKKIADETKSPIHMALDMGIKSNGFWTLLTYLLISCKRNVDVNSELKNGNTVLHVACLNKQISGDDQEEVVQLLLKHGADPIKLNKNGKIPLDLLQISAKCHEHLKDITLEKRKVPIKKIRALADNGDKLSKEYRNIESIAKYTEALDLLTQGPLKENARVQLLARIYLSRADKNYQMGYVADAQLDATNVVKYDRWSYQAHMLLGNIGMKHKKYKDALGEYNKSLEISQFQSSEKNIARAQQGFLDAICAGAASSNIKQVVSDVVVPDTFWVVAVEILLNQQVPEALAHLVKSNLMKNASFEKIDYYPLLYVEPFHWKTYAERVIIYLIDRRARLQHIRHPNAHNVPHSLVLFSLDKGSTVLLEHVLTKHLKTYDQVNEVDFHGSTLLHTFADYYSERPGIGKVAREVLDCLLKFDTVDLFAKDYGGDMAVDMFKTGYIHRTLKSRMAEIQKDLDLKPDKDIGQTYSQKDQKECSGCHTALEKGLTLRVNKKAQAVTKLVYVFNQNHITALHETLVKKASACLVNCLSTTDSADIAMSILELQGDKLKTVSHHLFEIEDYEQLHRLLSQYKERVMPKEYKWISISNTCLAVSRYGGGKKSSYKEDLAVNLDVSKFIKSNFGLGTQEKRRNMIEDLMLFRAPPNGMNQDSLITALNQEDYYSLQKLLYFGADPCRLSNEGIPLHVALDIGLTKDKGNFHILQLLLDVLREHPEWYGGELEPDSVDSDGNTLFHIAACVQFSRHALKAITILCEYDLNPNLHNKKQKTALQCLPKSNKEDKRERLIKEAGQKFEIKTEQVANTTKSKKKKKKGKKLQVKNGGDHSELAVNVNQGESEDIIGKTKLPTKDLCRQNINKLLQDMANCVHPVLQQLARARRRKMLDDINDDNENVSDDEFFDATEFPERCVENGDSTCTNKETVHDKIATEHEIIDDDVVNDITPDKRESEVKGHTDGQKLDTDVALRQNAIQDDVGKFGSDDEEEIMESALGLDDPTIFDGLEWEVECTAEVWKVLKDRHVPENIKRRVVSRVQQLASGEWGKALLKKLAGVTDDILLYEAKLSKAARILWEVAVAFSPQKSETPENYLDLEKGKASGRVYSEIIRVWDIVLNHGHINKSVKRINQSHKRGATCAIHKNLQGMKQPENQSNAYVIKRLPKIYFEAAADDKDKFYKQQKHFFPPASPSNTEYHILKFYSFNSALVANVLLNQNIKVDFPFKVTELEHSIINLHPNPPAPIILLGRSGTGKTTCCLYRLWSAFLRYWETSRRAGFAPLLERQVVYVRRETSKENDTEEEEEDAVTDEEDVSVSMASYKNMHEEVTGVCAASHYEYEKNSVSPLSDCDSESENSCTSCTEEPSVSGIIRVFDHLQQVFVTKNAVLCSEVQRNFSELSYACPAAAKHSEAVLSDLPYRFEDVPSSAYPLFLTSRQFLLILDASLPQPYFFERKEDGSLRREVEGWLESDSPLTPLLETGDVSEIHEDEEVDDMDLTEKHVEYDPRKEITYDCFLEKFWSAMRKNTRTEYHPTLVWMEITSFIEGSIEALNTEKGYLSLEEYQKIGRKRAANFTGDRDLIYSMFETYWRLKKQKGWFDEGDIVYNLYHRLDKQDRLDWVIHQFYVDETQDFTQAELCLLIRSCQNPNNMFLTGDTAQSIMRGIAFRFQDLKSLFYYASESLKAVGKSTTISVPNRLHQLIYNYRSHTGILRLASSVVDLLINFFPDSFDRLQPDLGLFDGPRPVLIESCDPVDLAAMLFDHHRETSQIEFGAHQAILVADEAAKDNLPEELSLANVLTIFQSKGLEFDDVLIYNFFKDSQAKKEWRVVTKHLNKLAEETVVDTSESILEIDMDILSGSDRPHPLDFNPDNHKVLNSELKHLYTALTRARGNVWIFDGDTDARAPMFEYFKARRLVTVLTESNKESHDMFAVKSSPAEWKQQGDKFFKHALYRNAAKCYEISGDLELYQYCLALNRSVQASRMGDKPREMREEFLYTAQDFLKCGKKDEAARCLYNAREFALAASVYEKNGKFHHAATLYKRIHMLDSAASTYVAALDFGRAVETFAQQQKYEAAIDAVKTYDSLVKQFKEICGQVPEVLIKKKPGAHTIKRMTLLAAKHKLNNGESQDSVMSVLDNLNLQDQVIFLKRNQRVDWSIPLRVRLGQKYEVAKDFYEAGKLERALEFTDEESQRTFRCEILLAIARKNIAQDQMLVCESYLLETLNLSSPPTVRAYADTYAEAQMLLGIITKDSKKLHLAADHYHRQGCDVGQFYCWNEIRKLSLNSRICRDLITEGLKPLLSFISDLEKASKKKTRRYRTCLEFYGLEDDGPETLKIMEQSPRAELIWSSKQFVSKEKFLKNMCDHLSEMAISMARDVYNYVIEKIKVLQQCPDFSTGRECSEGSQCVKRHQAYDYQSYIEYLRSMVTMIELKNYPEQHSDNNMSPSIGKIISNFTNNDIDWLELLHSSLWPKYHFLLDEASYEKCALTLYKCFQYSSLEKYIKRYISQQICTEIQTNTDLIFKIYAQLSLTSAVTCNHCMTDMLAKWESDQNKSNTRPAVCFFFTAEKGFVLHFCRNLLYIEAALYVRKEPMEAVGYIGQMLTFLARRPEKPLMPSLSNTVMFLEYAVTIAACCYLRKSLNASVLLPRSYIASLNMWNEQHKQGENSLYASVQYATRKQLITNGRIRSLVRIFCGETNSYFNVLSDSFYRDPVRTGEAERSLVMALVLMGNSGYDQFIPLDVFSKILTCLKNVEYDSAIDLQGRLLSLTEQAKGVQFPEQVNDILRDLLSSRHKDSLCKCTWRWDRTFRGIQLEKLEKSSPVNPPLPEKAPSKEDDYIDDDADEGINREFEQEQIQKAKEEQQQHLSSSKMITSPVAKIDLTIYEGIVDQNGCGICGIEFNSEAIKKKDGGEEEDWDAFQPSDTNNLERPSDYMLNKPVSPLKEEKEREETLEAHLKTDEHIVKWQHYLAYKTFKCTNVDPVIEDIRAYNNKNKDIDIIANDLKRIEDICGKIENNLRQLEKNKLWESVRDVDEPFRIDVANIEKIRGVVESTLTEEKQRKEEAAKAPEELEGDECLAGQDDAEQAEDDCVGPQLPVAGQPQMNVKKKNRKRRK